MFEHSVCFPSVEDIAWMALGGKELHQSMLTVLVIQMECSPYKQRSERETQADADQLVRTCHIEDDHKEEDGKQSTCEDEEVLCLQALELNRMTDALVDWVASHKSYTLLYYRKNERRMVALTMRKMQAPNQLAAVLLVSGSPDENLPYTLMPPMRPTTAPMA